mgnify:CR=1 FL=1
MLSRWVKFALITVIISLASCGGQEEGPSSAESPETGFLLEPFDSIGVELGDSNYVLGTPRALEFTSAGNIVVGDIGRMKMMMYSDEGLFLRSGGSEGEGPGEYAMPTGFAPDNSGGIIVTDAMGGKIIFYDSLLQHTGELRGFQGRPPQSPRMLSDGSIVGSDIDFDRENGNITNTISRWEPGETEASVSYMERSGSFDQQNPMQVYQEIGMVLCVLEDDRVVVSPLSSDDYILKCFSPGGELMWETERDYDPRPLPEEEIRIRREMMRAAMSSRGMDPSAADDFPIQEMASAVNSVYAREGEIWVRRGGYVIPRFEIFSEEGEFLYSCSAPFLAQGSNAGFAMSPASDIVLAYLANPEDYYRIWMLRKIETDPAEE